MAQSTQDIIKVEDFLLKDKFKKCCLVIKNQKSKDITSHQHLVRNFFE